MKKCTNCGSAVWQNEIKCKVCGTLIAQETNELPKFKICQVCGEKIKAEYSFCMLCGARVENVADKQSPACDLKKCDVCGATRVLEPEADAAPDAVAVETEDKAEFDIALAFETETEPDAVAVETEDEAEFDIALAFETETEPDVVAVETEDKAEFDIALAFETETEPDAVAVETEDKAEFDIALAFEMETEPDVVAVETEDKAEFDRNNGNIASDKTEEIQSIKNGADFSLGLNEELDFTIKNILEEAEKNTVGMFNTSLTSIFNNGKAGNVLSDMTAADVENTHNITRVLCQNCSSELINSPKYCSQCGCAVKEDSSTKIKIVKCEYCGTISDKGHPYCSVCGKKLEIKREFCVYCGAGLKAGQKNCISCGAVVADIESVLPECSECGRKLQSDFEFCPTCGKKR